MPPIEVTHGIKVITGSERNAEHIDQLRRKIKTIEETLDKLLIAFNNIQNLANANTEHLRVIGEFLTSADTTAERLIKKIGKTKA